VPAEIGQSDDVPVCVLVYVKVAFVLHADHDQLVDVTRAVNELLEIGALSSKACLHDLVAIIEVSGRGVKIAGVADDLLDPPSGSWT
jgi:hypothetical protein